MWEFWRLAHDRDGWRAAWGGAIKHTSRDRGVYGPASWPGAHRWWGISASSLSLPGGLITPEQLDAGQIDHALALAVPGVRAGVFAAPAQRTDGRSVSDLAVPEGAHLRLNPRLDVAALGLPRVTRLIAEAAQRFGVYVTDTAPELSFFAEAPMQRDRYAGPRGYFDGEQPNELLAGFPWSELEVLRMSLHRGACAAARSRGHLAADGACG
jgi:hypothetical protein